jgi:hypothetical protein
MKIAVIGSGNSGIISTIMSIYKHRKNNVPDPSVTVFHDPNTPTEIVGQGTTLEVSHAIHKILKVDERLDNPVGITPKVGFFYKNWAKKNKELLYKLGNNALAYHYDPKLLREHFLKSNLCSFVERKCSPEDISDEFDLVFDCRGKSVNDLKTYNKLLSPVNSCLLGRSCGQRNCEVWTENIATPDGWCFKIPLTTGYSYGYVFNEKITDVDEAKNNFKSIFNVDVMHHISFDNYLSRSVFYDKSKKTILNGNRLFFLEPLESTATPMYGVAADTAMGMYYESGKYSIESLESGLLDRINEVHEWILWHYYYGSDYDTKFWRHAKELSRSFKYSDKFLSRIKYVKQTYSENIIRCDPFPREIAGEFAYDDYLIWLVNNDVEI